MKAICAPVYGLLLHIKSIFVYLHSNIVPQSSIHANAGQDTFLFVVKWGWELLFEIWFSIPWVQHVKVNGTTNCSQSRHPRAIGPLVIWSGCVFACCVYLWMHYRWRVEITALIAKLFTSQWAVFLFLISLCQNSSSQRFFQSFNIWTLASLLDWNQICILLIVIW